MARVLDGSLAQVKVTMDIVVNKLVAHFDCHLRQFWNTCCPPTKVIIGDGHHHWVICANVSEKIIWTTVAVWPTFTAQFPVNLQVELEWSC